MKLSKNEREVKTYTYATIGKVKSNLTVTTKRVILSKEGKLRGTKINTCEEISLNSIEKVSSSMTVKARPALFIFALIFAIATVAVYLFLYKQNLTLIAGGILTLLFLIAFFTNRKRTFFLNFVTGVYEGLDLMANVGAIKQVKKKKKNVKNSSDIKVRLSSSVAKTIVEEIGSVILDAKEFSEDEEDVDSQEIIETQETQPIVEAQETQEEASIQVEV